MDGTPEDEDDEDESENPMTAMSDPKFKRKQWRRQVNCALYLKERLDSFVTYRQTEEFKTTLRKEAFEELAKASYGKELLGVIGMIYSQYSCRNESKCTFLNLHHNSFSKVSSTTCARPFSLPKR